MAVTNSEAGTSLQSVDRALHVLELLAEWGSGGVSELAGEIGVHKSTAFRLLGALEARQMVQQDADRGKYRLGFGLVRLARRVNVQLDLSEQARPLTDELARAVGESINVAVLREHFAVNVVQSQGEASVVSQNWIGQLTPLHATSSGKVLLAHLDGDRQAELVGRELDRFTPNTLSDPERLTKELQTVLELGHAVTYGELELGLNGVAVPVRDEDGRVIAALSAAGPAYRLSRDRIAEILPQLLVTAAEVSWRMGYRAQEG